jgi:hypothetical protein
MSGSSTTDTSFGMDYTIMQPKHQAMDRNLGLDSTDISSRGWSFSGGARGPVGAGG